MKVKVCIDDEAFETKPSNKKVPAINARIAEQAYEVTLEELANAIQTGHTWCPAVFTGCHKKKEEIAQQSLFALDFDHGITLEEALSRARQYHLPVALCYETFSSENYDRFRLVFAHCMPVMDYRICILIQMALYMIFPESDSSGKTDPSKIYYGGRNVIISNQNVWPYFNVYDLIISMYTYIRQTNTAHFARKLNEISSTTGIIQQNGLLLLDFSEQVGSAFPPPLNDDLLNNSKNGEFVASSQYIYWENATNSPKICNIYFQSQYIVSENKYEIIKLTGKSIQLIRDIDLIAEKEKCRLFREFVTGERKLEHMEWFNLLRNLIHIKGGQNLFKDTVYEHSNLYDQPEHRIEQMNQAVKSCYKPLNCDTWCPYCNECNHGKNVIATLKRSKNEIMRLKETTESYSLEEARIDLQDKLSLIFSHPAQDITLLKSDTGTGKTHLILQYMQSNTEPVLLAVPTHQLIDEIYEKACSMSIPVMRTPSIQILLKAVPEIAEEIQYLYNTGAEEQVTVLLREYQQIHPLSIIEEYLSELKKIDSWKGHILTTHARLIHMKESILQSHRVTIDEDIFPTLAAMKTVSLLDLCRFQEALEAFPHLQSHIDSILKKAESDSRIFKCTPIRLNFKDKKELWTCMQSGKHRFHSAVLHIFSAKAFGVSLDKSELTFVCQKHLPANIPYLITSATADEKLYRKIFPFQNVRTIQCKKAALCGKIILHHDKTYSRTCFQAEPELFERLHQKHPDMPFITFKDMDAFGSKEDLHFGACQGHNHLKGQSIVVAGTPHKDDLVYKLLAAQFDMDWSGVLSNRAIRRNGFEFTLATYDNADLQAIQLYYIESDLLQAVGRARLTEYPVVVHLYSNFPVEGCLLAEELAAG